MSSLLRPLRFTVPAGAVVLAILFAAAVAGCGNFQDVSSVIDLRVLAISADPPEILIDPTMLDGPPFQTKLTALIADPAGGDRTINVDALACPREIDAVTAATGKNGVVCKPFDPQSADPDASVAVTPLPPDSPVASRTSFGDAQLDIPYTFPTDLLVRGYKLDPFAQLGFQMPITFQLTIAAGSESEIAIKRVIFTVPPPDHTDQPANANPRITGLTGYFSRDGEANAVDPRPFDLDQPTPLVLGSSLWLEPQGADTQAETYFTRTLTHDANPQVVVTEVKETLRYSFFASAGIWSPPLTNNVPPVLRSQPQRIHLESNYRAPAVMPSDPQVTFWIVVRDERGGASWTKGRFLLVPAGP